MSRELRFRIWSNEPCFKEDKEIKGCYVSPSRIRIDSSGTLKDSHDEDSIIEQYVGFSDVNGIPIYENDIVQARYVDYNARLDEYATRWPSYWLSGKIFFSKGNFWCEQQEVSNLKDIKIIGNVHDK